MNIIEEKKKLEKLIEKKEAKYNENMERIAKAKGKIDEESIIRKKGVDERYSLIQSVYQKQIEKLYSEYENVNSIISQKCSFSFEEVICVILDILYEITKMEFNIKVINSNIKKNCSYIELYTSFSNIIIDKKININNLDEMINIDSLAFKGNDFLVNALNSYFQKIVELLMNDDATTLEQAFKSLTNNNPQRNRK